ncbi:putative DSB repair complex subunit Ku70 [Pseudovirgaria hyperparasitica]|uniref:ATP-dependent DNA helicase II subunit 1 n=1 Tax=Pseudovirgaria hyperparasitica TaxID=470096 RepID=A0A6A6WNA0_9PEZI|nr:putative DSB repair complex subunit Ku70 [Pseudovirgaria hyperparasitica]KAF2763519.1 putative DSB repair complex subunit Ku70 [Pseudovirgaria hyperparasitica]
MSEGESWRRNADEAQEEEEEVDESGYKTVKDAVLFAIDVSKTMLQKPTPTDGKKADRDSPTSAALKCAYQLMQQRIISNPNDMMGILLFGTEKSKLHGGEDGSGTGMSYPNCYLVSDLDVPSAEDVKRLRNLVEDDFESSKLLRPTTDAVSMANVLFCANQIFTTKAPNFSSRRLFLVSDNDDPHENDKDSKSAAAVRAKDLYDLGVVIELFPIAKPGHGFDRSRFYDDIVYRSSTGEPDAPAPVSTAAKVSSSGDGISLLQSLLSSVNSKAAPRRAAFSLPLEIAPGLKIGVKGYILVKRQEPVRTCYVWVGGEKPQLAISSTTQLAEDTAKTVEKSEVRKAYKFGGETISFTPEEITQIRSFGDPTLRIIGFKPASLLPVWANTRPAYFIYPSETDFIGSTRVFSALQQKLLQDDKIGLAWFIPRRNATPTLAALVPGEEKLGDDGDQVIPPGLWIVQLPFADDIRQKPEIILTRTTDTLTDMMRIVIQQLQLPKAVYDPIKYPNPSLQWFYRILQAIALDEDVPDKAEDKTIPKYRQIDKRAGSYVVTWGNELEQTAQKLSSLRPPVKGIKRGSEDPDSAPTKRLKAVKTDSGSMTDNDMKKRYAEKSISKLTVPILKEWASSKHIPIDGKKADLIERIEEYFENK